MEGSSGGFGVATGSETRERDGSDEEVRLMRLLNWLLRLQFILDGKPRAINTGLGTVYTGCTRAAAEEKLGIVNIKLLRC